MPSTQEILPVTASNPEKVHPFSRFFTQDLFINDGTRFWGTWNPVNIPFSPRDSYVEVTSATAGRLDLLAYTAYQSPELWWVIAQANNIFFPAADVQVGDILRIPDKVTIQTLNLSR